MMWPYYMSGWNWLVAAVMMVAFWAAVIFAIASLIRAVWTRSDGLDDAMATLRRRLASGEITPDEFESRKNILHG